ncbi:protein Bouncer-like [Takifugu rubripes]|nr:protein Bouncer-like [Takifugu rubripes]
MKGLMFCVFAIVVLMPAQGEEDEKPEHLMDSLGHEDKNDFMKCFQCDLGFWDVCYTTKTICSLEERCFTGRGKAGDLDIKTLGCVKAEECGVETTVQLFANKTIFVITKHCCDTPFCNSAHKLLKSTFFYLAVAFLATWHITEASASS